MAILTESQLDKQAARDAVSTFIRLQARDWHRRQMNRVWEKVSAEIDTAWANGDAVDIPALIRQVFAEPETLGLK